ncbi:MAG: hypothetical protein LE168_02230 [Endomicrobium sp.]|nr:hypothetical protein [Endomicrobium sp.]
MKPCKCGSTEFVSNPNSYDVFELVVGKLEFIRMEFADEEEDIFCRECAKKIKIK